MKLVHICVATITILLATCLIFAAATRDDEIPYPFSRELKYSSTEPMSGKDVYTLQHLLNRWSTKPNLQITQIYDYNTSKAIAKWKVSKGLPNDTIFDRATAFVFLEDFEYDGYKDQGIKAADLGLQFRLYVPVYRNRSIETTATLFDAHNNVLHKFTTRTRAHTIYGEEPWPTWDSETKGLNEFTSWGYTPSGLTLLDFNTPEPESVFDLYGKWEVIRAVRGLEGNAAICMPYLRNGILMHTGNWAKHGWTEDKPMPNSSGCMHNHPTDQEIIVNILKAKGVTPNVNPFGKLPYPYEPQGLLSVEVIDDDQIV
jgi:hypothetical protein